MKTLRIASDGFLGNDGILPISIASSGYIAIEIEIDYGDGKPIKKTTLWAREIKTDDEKLDIGKRRELILMAEDEEILLILNTFAICN